MSYGCDSCDKCVVLTGYKYMFVEMYKISDFCVFIGKFHTECVVGFCKI